MMKVKAKIKTEFLFEGRKELELFLTTNAIDKSFTFDEVRAAVGKTKAVLPDGYIHQVALDLGFEVEV